MESSVSIETAKHLLSQFGLILAAGSLCGFFSRKIKVPDVAIFLVAGMLMGPATGGIINIPADSALNQIIVLFGACYILFDGGASIKLSVLKEVWITLTVIATVGVLITAAITGAAAHVALGLPFITALLLGSTIAATDPATIVPIFRQVKVKERVAQTVISESAFNDAMGAIVTFAILAVAIGSNGFSWSASLIDLLKQAVVGILIGIGGGYSATLAVAHKRMNFLAEFVHIVTLTGVIAAYLTADMCHASGFMAVFVFGVMIGNRESFGFTISHRDHQKLDEFMMTTSLIMRMFIFILLGTQVDFSLMSQHWVGGCTVVAVFMFIARPITVFACAFFDRRAKWHMNELLFMCWTRETGVIPAALAGLLIGIKAPGAHIIASVTFIAILMTILVQATTTKWLAKQLGLLRN